MKPQRKITNTTTVKTELKLVPKQTRQAKKAQWTRWIIGRILRDGAVFLVLLFPYMFI